MSDEEIKLKFCPNCRSRVERHPRTPEHYHLYCESCDMTFEVGVLRKIKERLGLGDKGKRNLKYEKRDLKD